MILTNLIMGFMLSTQNIDNTLNKTILGDTSPVYIQLSNQFENISDEREISDRHLDKIFNYIQSINLIYRDIYEFTKPNLYKTFVYQGKNHHANELNPIADIFFKNNLWDLAFISAGLLNYMFYNMDAIYPYYTAVLNVSEILAITTWDNVNSDEINVHASLYIKSF